MEAPTDNDDGNPNLRTTPSSLSPSSAQAAAALHIINDDNSAPVPLAQIDAANAEMELEYEARYGPTKNMKGRPELIQDEEAPMPSQAQINAAQEEMESEAKASSTADKACFPSVPHIAPQLPERLRVIQSIGDSNAEDELLDSKKPAASTMQTESLEDTAQQLSSVEPARRESRPYPTASRGIRQSYVRRNQRQAMASAATRIRQESMASSQSDNTRDAVSSPPLLVATLVEDQPEIPIYDAVPINSDDTSLPLPWWKRRRGFIVGGFGLLVGMAIALGVSLNSNRSSESTAPPTSSSFNDSVTLKPTKTPTQAPSTSSQPSSAPSSVPSSPPSTSPPSVSPTPQPTASPVLDPTSSPSTNVTAFIKRDCNLILQVEQLEEFNDIQVGSYELIMESYTSEFGHMVGIPQIKTTSEVTDQTTAGGRRLQGDNAKNLLVMDFTMQYESRYGYDIDYYPSKFSAYVNANLEKLTADMKERFLPVVEVQDVIVYNTAQPTMSPSHLPTSSLTPTTAHAPSSIPSSVPTYYPTVSHQPSGVPSNATEFVKRQCNQILQVEQLEDFNDIQVGIYELIMEGYTSEFGHMVGIPQIRTTGEVTDQTTAGGRRLQGDNAKNLLIMDFTMQYESRYGYDIDDYPSKFSAYVNANLEKVTADMKERFLPVVEVQDVIVYNTAQPTMSPSNSRGN